MTEAEYRQHPAISRSELWHIGESPQKFRFYKDNPQAPTPSLLFGQVFHKMALEPGTFETEFIVEPELNRRTNAGKEGLAVLTPEERLVLDRFFIHPEKGAADRLAGDLHLDVKTVYRRKDAALLHFTISLYGGVES